MKKNLIITRITLILLLLPILNSCFYIAPGRLLPKVKEFNKNSIKSIKPKVLIRATYHKFFKYKDTEPVMSVGDKKWIKDAITQINENTCLQ